MAAHKYGCPQRCVMDHETVKHTTDIKNYFLFLMLLIPNFIWLGNIPENVFCDMKKMI